MEAIIKAPEEAYEIWLSRDLKAEAGEKQPGGFFEAGLYSDFCLEASVACADGSLPFITCKCVNRISQETNGHSCISPLSKRPESIEPY